MNLNKIFSYLYYTISKGAPSSKLRLFGLKRVSYVQVGKNCYLGPSITITPFGGGKTYSKKSNEIFLTLGDRVAVSPNVSFLCSMHPENSKLSEIYGKIKPIIIEDDVWIGAGAIILAGVTLHRCSVIGAGALVTKDVPEKTVVAGVPAKYLKDVPDFEGKS